MQSRGREAGKAMVMEVKLEPQQSTPGMLSCARLAISDTHHYESRPKNKTGVQSAHSCAQDEDTCSLGAGRLERPC